MRRVACGSTRLLPIDRQGSRTDKRTRAAAMLGRSCILFDASFVFLFGMLDAFRSEQTAGGTWEGGRMW
jgi:hypothetical protein